MFVEEAMSKSVLSVHPSSTFEQAAILMRDRDVGSLPVVENNVLVGIVTDRDLVVRGLASAKDGPYSRVYSVMTPHVQVCRVGDNIETAVTEMAHGQVRRLPVVDEHQRLVGMISLADLAREREDAASFVLGEVSDTLFDIVDDDHIPAMIILSRDCHQ